MHRWLVAVALVAVSELSTAAWGASCRQGCAEFQGALRRECARDCRGFKRAPFCRNKPRAERRDCKSTVVGCVAECGREWPDQSADGRVNRKHCQFVCKECRTRASGGGNCIEGSGPTRSIRCCGGPGEPACCAGVCCTTGTCCFGAGGGRCCSDGQTCTAEGECVDPVPQACLLSACVHPLLVADSCCEPPGDGIRRVKCQLPEGCICCPAGSPCDPFCGRP